MRNKTLIANDENVSGDSAVVMRCAAAKDDVRKLEAHGLSVPAARRFVTLRASANNVMRKLEAHGLSVPAAAAVCHASRDRKRMAKSLSKNKKLNDSSTDGVELKKNSSILEEGESTTMKTHEETTMAKKTIENGLFVTFEGPEGSGKTTQIKMLAERLTEQEYEVVTTREPGGTILGEEIRKLLIEFHEEDIADEAELLLFGAARAQHMRRKILPCLKRGGIVLCDRFVDSTTAYQGYARKLDFGFIQNLHTFSLLGRWPDLTFVLDIDVDTSYQRMNKRYANSAPVNDRIEAESRAFHTAVREGFLDIAKKNPGRVKVIDANRLPEIIAADLWWEVYHAIV